MRFVPVTCAPALKRFLCDTSSCADNFVYLPLCFIIFICLPIYCVSNYFIYFFLRSPLYIHLRHVNTNFIVQCQQFLRLRYRFYPNFKYRSVLCIYYFYYFCYYHNYLLLLLLISLITIYTSNGLLACATDIYTPYTHYVLFCIFHLM